VFDVVEPMKCIVSTNLKCFLESNLFYKFGDILSKYVQLLCFPVPTSTPVGRSVREFIYYSNTSTFSLIFHR
jgi:hypothetical protein